MARSSARQSYRILRMVAALGAGLVVLGVTLALGVSWPVALTGSWGVVSLVTVTAV